MSGLAVDLAAAERRLLGRVLTTPLIEWRSAGIWLKCESQQITGSFKYRGALNKVLALDPADRRRGLVAASAGNHGIGVAVAARLTGCPATVVVPAEVVERKRRMLEKLGAEVILADGDFGIAEAAGKALARARGGVWVSPYNDADVVAGQGTLGLELARQLRSMGQPQRVFVPVSGGGLLAGVGLALRREASSAAVVGVQTASAPYMHRFFHGGHVEEVVERPTLADGLAGPIEAGSMTFDLVRATADDVVLVDEDELAAALADLASGPGILVEPAAAAAVAAARRDPLGVRIAVLSGGNVDIALAQRLAGTSRG